MATSGVVRGFVRYAVVFAGIVSAVPAGAAGFSEEDALQKGRQSATALLDGLQEKLASSLKTFGSTEAMRFCGYQAQALVGEIAANHGVTMRRTSLKLRNPANAPDPQEKEMLERFASQEREGGGLMSEVMTRASRQGKPVWYYARPILAGPVCLACHAAPDRIPPATRELLRRMYPDDRATGYKPGDFRGIVSVVIPAE